MKLMSELPGPIKHIRAIDALEEAQKLAFAPFVFQATVSLRKLGVFDIIFERRKKGGISIDEISKELAISAYGVSVLLEIAESSNIVIKKNEDKYELTKIGYFLNYNETVNVNMNFTNDICYKGLFHLNESIKTGKPEGLVELGDWDNIYKNLSRLSPVEQKSWFEFDHHYSDGIFDEALEIVFRNNPKMLFDVGGNTGKFALSCCNYNSVVSVQIIDLPSQLNKALQNVKNNKLEDRITGFEIDWLQDEPQIPGGADVIWMCQFLDCFSKDEILKILTTCVASMSDDTELMIMETYTDRQKFDNAKFILEATSLYFTALANGNSKMYKASEFLELIDKSGMVVKEDLSVGEYHTIFVCKKK